MEGSIWPIVLAVLGGSGFWALLKIVVQHFMQKKSALHEAVVGLLHDRVYQICHSLIERGSVTTEEYDNLKYLYEPYIKLGGNGTAKRLKEEVDKLNISQKGETNE